MQHEANSLNTKRTLAEELRRQGAAAWPDGKVTVRSLVQSCGINRNTFYYHFSNIDELILWTLQSDLEKLRQFDCTDGHGIRVFIMDYLDDNRTFLNFAFQYVGFDPFRRAFISVMHKIIMEYIEYHDGQLGIRTDAMKARVLADSFAEMTTALMVWYFRDEGKPSRLATGKVFDGVFTYGIPGLLAEKE